MAHIPSKRYGELKKLYDKGLSAREIAVQYGCDLDAIYYALRKADIVRRSHAENSRLRFESKAASYLLRKALSKNDERLKIAATMLYWAEGYKTNKSKCVDFANSDPIMARLFRKFLTRICGIDESRLRVLLYCYSHQNVNNLIDYWSVQLGVPKSQFTKPYVKQGQSGPQGDRMPWGLVHLRYSDKKLLQQVLSWIQEYQHKCVGGGVVNRTRL